MSDRREVRTASQSTSSCCSAMPLLEGRVDSDAKDAERGSRCRGRWAAIRTPCAPGIGRRELGPNIQEDNATLDYRHLRDNISRNVQAFRRDAIRPARLRNQHRALGLNVWVIHGCVIVSHSRHGVQSLTAVALSLHSRVAFTPESANPGGSNNPSQQNSQENYRSCGSSSHFSKFTLGRKESANSV
jgi:hypothetical protein